MGDQSEPTRLVPEPAGASLVDAWYGHFAFRDITFERAETMGIDEECQPDPEEEFACESPFDRDGAPEGLFGLGGSVTFERVSFAQNSGYWGGAITLGSEWGPDTTVTFTDCAFTGNAAVQGTSGGAILVASDQDARSTARTTLVSTNTDWGTGDDDNTPDDIAFASWDGYFHDSLTVHASYSFDGVADFTCDADTYACE